jgi:formylglycine-generating enzyme required for sulfatase activity
MNSTRFICTFWPSHLGILSELNSPKKSPDTFSPHVNRLHTIKLESAPECLCELAPHRSRARDILRLLRADPVLDSKVCLLASLALLPDDVDQVEYLCERLVTGSLDEFPLIRDALLPHRAAVAATLWSILESPRALEADGRRPFRAGVALATFDPPTSPATAQRWQAHAELIARQLVEAVTYNPAMYGSLVQVVSPAASVLLAPLVAIARHHTDAQRRSWATNLTAHFAADDPSTLVDLACDVASEQYNILFDRLKPQAARAVEAARAELHAQPAADANQTARITLARRQANAAATLMRLEAASDVWSLWRRAPDPTRRSYLIHRVGPLGVDPRLVAPRLADESDVSAQRAMILALGEMVSVETPAGAEVVRESCEHIQRLFREHPDPGVHGAAEWTLRRWKHPDTLVLSPESVSERNRGLVDRRWHINRQGHTLVLIPGPVEFLMGSPPDEEARIGGPKDSTEQQHRKRIGRSYAIAAHPVTVEQFQRFRTDHPFDEKVSPGPSHPANRVTWYEAAAYCNWLSEQEGIPRDQWCYDPKQRFAEGMRVPEDFLERQGYRLPTESEWEYACRAETVTSYYFGESEELLGQYAWYTKLSNDKSMLPVGTLKPNDWGLFDMLGNAFEWCHDAGLYYIKHADGSVTDDEPPVDALNDRGTRVLRGGGFMSVASGVRSAYRGAYQPANRFVYNGFRVARTYR